MATATRKSPRATAVNQELIGQASALLQELPEKQKEDLSLREAVEQMQEPLRAALAKGYNYQDLANILAEKGIKISALTLKNYVPSGKRQTTKTKAKRAKQSVSEESIPVEPASAKTASPQEPPEVAAPDVPTAPTPARRGRAKSAETTKPAAVTTNAGSETSVRSSRTRKTSTTEPATKAPSTRGRRKSDVSK